MTREKGSNEESRVTKFFSKNFTVLNFLIQSGMLVVLLGLIFQFGTYFQKLNDLTTNVSNINTSLLEISKKIQDNNNQIIMLDKDVQNNIKRIDRNDIKINDIERCQNNKKFCK